MMRCAKRLTENGGAAGADTRLRIDLKGRNPDDGLTDIAYEKGAAFLRTIEVAVGRERFDAWMKGWFDRHQFEPVTTSLFLADIREHLIKGDAALEAKLNARRNGSTSRAFRPISRPPIRPPSPRSTPRSPPSPKVPRQ